jgi:hypothetical protein
VTKNDIKLIRFTQIIKDPFPEHTKHERFSRFKTLFGGPEKPEDISIWKAYKMGYDKAYEEILERLPDN